MTQPKGWPWVLFDDEAMRRARDEKEHKAGNVPIVPPVDPTAFKPQTKLSTSSPGSKLVH